MALLTTTTIFKEGGASLGVLNTLGASDTFQYNAGKNQELIFTNNTAGALTINILGDLATTVKGCGGFGDGIDVSSGYDIAIGIGETQRVTVSQIQNYLAATDNQPTITGGDACTCLVLEA